MKNLSSLEVPELCSIVRSCEAMLNPGYKGKFDEIVKNRCELYCEQHSINITHGSAFKELRHKSYYYINKNIDDIIDTGTDTHCLYKYNIIKDKQIVNKLFKRSCNK